MIMSVPKFNQLIVILRFSEPILAEFIFKFHRFTITTEENIFFSLVQLEHKIIEFGLNLFVRQLVILIKLILIVVILIFSLTLFNFEIMNLLGTTIGGKFKFVVTLGFNLARLLLFLFKVETLLFESEEFLVILIVHLVTSGTIGIIYLVARLRVVKNAAVMRHLFIKLRFLRIKFGDIKLIFLFLKQGFFKRLTSVQNSRTDLVSGILDDIGAVKRGISNGGISSALIAWVVNEVRIQSSLAHTIHLFLWRVVFVHIINITLLPFLGFTVIPILPFL